MSKILDYIKIGAGIVIVLGLLAWVFLIKNTAEKPINAGVNQTAQLSEELVDSNKTKYDNLEVGGEVVVEAINDLKDELCDTFSITVKTFKTIAASPSGGTKFNSPSVSFPAKDTDGYINPRGTFKGSITYDANKTITGLVFTQIK